MIRFLYVCLLFVSSLLSGCGASPAIIEHIDDAAHARVGVMTGSTGEVIAMARLPEAEIKSFDDIMDAVAALNAGQLDAIITGYPAAAHVAAKNPTLHILPEPLSQEDTAIALRKEDTLLHSQLDALINDLKKDGTLQDLKRRWFKTTPGDYERIDIQPPATGEILRIGVSATREPFNFVDKNGQITGHDGELARIIGARLERPIEFSNMKFMGLIPALQSGKVDIIVTGMTATEERKKLVSFTQPYFANAQTMLVRKTAGYGASETSSSEPSFLASLTQSFQSNILHEKRYLLIWYGLKTTIVISILATLFGTLLGALVCYMRMSPRTLLNLPARVYINILRGIPVLVLLMLIYYVVFASINISPLLVAVIAFGMNFGAYVAEIYRAGIQSIDRGQTEAGISMGLTKLQTFLYIILPQTIQRILPVYKGEFISLVKMTSIVGYIAVQDLTKASDIIRSRTFDAFFPLVMVAILYFLISWTLMLALEYLERRTNPQYRRRKVAQA
jgi:polar amino acid transport system substrate-binding protein